MEAINETLTLVKQLAEQLNEQEATINVSPEQVRALLILRGMP